MTSEQRAQIEAKIGRTLTAEEIGRGSINRPQTGMTWEQEKADRRAKIAAANQQQETHQPRWMQSTIEAGAALANSPRRKYPDGRPRETPKEFRQRMQADREQRAADTEAATEETEKLVNDPVYQRMNQVAAQTVERLRWDSSYPQSVWERALQMQQAAKDNDTEAFLALNKEHVEYLESTTKEKQSAIDNQIAQLQQAKQSFSQDRYEEPLPTPDKSTYGHIRRASGMMQFVNNADGFISQYDPRVPGARESAEQKLAQHQAATAGIYQKPIPFSALTPAT